MRAPSRNADSELRKKVTEIQDAMCINMAGVADELNISVSGLSLTLARGNPRPEFLEKLDRLLTEARAQKADHERIDNAK